jgi:hypothetical protein
MRVLEDLGFIQAKPKGGWHYGYVLLATFRRKNDTGSP